MWTSHQPNNRNAAQVETRPAPKCETRPGIGLCDECGLPKWPQEYVGYGSMVCLDCLNAETLLPNAELTDR